MFEQHTALLLPQNAGENRADSQPVRKSTVLFSPAERGADITRRFVDINAQPSLAGYLPTGQWGPCVYPSDAWWKSVHGSRSGTPFGNDGNKHTHTHTLKYVDLYTNITFQFLYTPLLSSLIIKGF